MRVGINLPNYGVLGRGPTLARIAERAEQAGFDSAWTTDHIVMPASRPEPYGSIVESMATVAFLAGRTTRLVLATSVIVLPQRDPILLAKQASAVYELSGGRFELGIGVGWVAEEYGFLNADFAHRGRLADEYLEIMQKLWTDPQAQHDGPSYRFRDVLFAPRPDRPGGVPVVVGGTSDAALRRAARCADGWQAIHVEPADVSAARARLVELAPTRPIEISLRIRVRVDGVVEVKAGPAIEGSADEVVARVAEYAAAGVAHLIVEFKTDDSSDFLGQLDAFADKVLGRIAGF